MHEITEHQAAAATCTENGNTEYYYCSDCGKYFSDEEGTTEISLSDTVIVATGHIWDEGEVTTAATCTENGNIEYYTCSACGKYFADEDGESGLTLSLSEEA